MLQVLQVLVKESVLSSRSPVRDGRYNASGIKGYFRLRVKHCLIMDLGGGGGGGG